MPSVAAARNAAAARLDPPDGEVWAVAETRSEDLLALDEALERLAALNERRRASSSIASTAA
jgi:hypothetical protein